MKRRAVKHTHRKIRTVRSRTSGQPQYLVLVRGWMFLVMFALMLGLGAVVGTALSNQFNQGQVAGVQVDQPLKAAK